MRTNRKGANCAIELLENIGFDEITEIPMYQFVSGLGATLIEEPLLKSDGIIIRGKMKTLIKVNSDIPYEQKKRFTIAHEVGHFLLHDKLEVHNENANTLNWFNSIENQMKKGIQEWEANDFATELLMPEKIFRKEVENKIFSPELISLIAKRFKTSLTSTAFRFINLNIRPIFLAFISNGKVRYWKKSNDMNVWVKDLNKLSPPEDSVAMEYIESNYDFIYSGKEKKQEISKSTWFRLNNYDHDSEFYEYCIPTKNYKTIISIVWED